MYAHQLQNAIRDRGRELQAWHGEYWGRGWTSIRNEERLRQITEPEDEYKGKWIPRRGILIPTIKGE